jgi:23S rRNA (guanosine2251-2'-O)-methyltransferase
VIAPKDRATGITPVVRKVAAGAAGRVPFYQITNLKRTLSELQQEGLWVIGTADEVDKNYAQIDYTSSIAIVMGAEEKGMRRLTRELCDELVTIPMAGEVSSLNVSVATGICLFEAIRQRQ